MKVRGNPPCPPLSLPNPLRSPRLPEAISSDKQLSLSPEFQKAYQATAQAERRSLEPFVARKERAETKLKALDEVLSRVDRVSQMLPEMNSPLAFRELNFTSANPGIVTGLLEKDKALPGEYALEVLDVAKSASALSNGFANRTDTVGTGYVTLRGVNGEEREIFIDPANGTLDGIARLINSSGLGYKASVVKEGSDPDRPWRLVMTAEGARAGDEVDFPQTFFVDGDVDLYVESRKPATNARVRYQGVELEHESNEIRDLIDGVTLNLRGVTEPGRPTTFQVERDVPKTTLKVKDLVESLNGVFSYIQNQYKHEPGEAPGTKPLSGDPGVRLAEAKLKSALQSTNLAFLGVELSREGTLKLDEKKLESALATDYERVNKTLVSDVVPRLHQAVRNISGRDGLVSGRKRSSAEQMRAATGDIEKREKQATQRLESLRQKLARAQISAEKLQRQTGALQSMPAAGNDPILRLLEAK